MLAYTVFLWPLLATLIAAVLAIYAWRRRTTTAALGFALLMAVVAGWSIGYTLELTGPDLAAKVLWAKLEYPFIAAVPLAWLILAMQYTGRQRLLSGRILALLAVIPLITTVIAFTNESHGLLWSQVGLATTGSLVTLAVTHGLWFWVHLAYSYLLLLVGTFWILQALRQSRNLYRSQALALLVGVLVPWLGNILYLAGFQPVPGLDLTPLAFTVSGILFALGIFQFRLFDVAPFARNMLIDSLTDGMMVFDQQGRVIDINPAACRIIGRTAANVLGQPAAQILSDWPNLLKPLTQKVEVMVARDYNIQLSALADERGRPAGRLLIWRDASEERLLAQMRQDLTNATVHDLRNPLAAILNSFEILTVFGGLDTSMVEILTIGKRNAMRMSGLVNAILEVSRLENGSVPLKHAEVDLSDLVTEVIQLQTPLAQEKNLRVLTDLPADLPCAWIDPDLISRVFQNLIGNAINFTPSGGSVVVRVEQDAADATQLLASVKDTGQGVPSEIQARLFQKFVRGAQEGRGSGLGLAFCRLAVEAHGQKIWVESLPGRGTVFKFTLPVVDSKVST